MNPDPQLTQESIRAVDAVARPAPQPSDLDAPELYINRELSWVDFNDRVLQLAEDADAAAARALQVRRDLRLQPRRVLHDPRRRPARPDRRGHHGAEARRPHAVGDDRRDPREGRWRSAERQCRTLSARPAPALAEHGIRLVGIDDVSAEARRALDERFRRQIFPVLTPLAVGLGRPFPYISNLSLSLARARARPGRRPGHLRARQGPEGDAAALRRAGRPSRRRSSPLEELIAGQPRRAVPGHGDHRARGLPRHARRRLRDLRRGRRPAAGRRGRAAPRAASARSCASRSARAWPTPLREQLTDALEVEDRQVYEVDGLLDLTDLWQIVGSPGLRRPARPAVDAGHPAAPAARGAPRQVDILAAMRAGDILVHHPYDSFATSVERFVEQAVNDPDVLAIKQTVYRTSDDSPLVPALIRATERGKQAVCLVELKARFDERANIEWARKLEETGVHVVYGHPALKTHAKCILVVRREGDGVRHYVHVGTGNYHPKTARLYTDFGLFTTDERARLRRRRHVQLPDRLRAAAALPQGADRARPPARRHRRRDRADDRGPRAPAKPARIRMKMNSLGRPDAASRRCTAPRRRACRSSSTSAGSAAWSRASRASARTSAWSRSSGRFLEHSRIYTFERGDEHLVLIGSADLMPRNLDTRVELVTPVRGPDPARRPARHAGALRSPTTRTRGSCRPTASGSVARATRAAGWAGRNPAICSAS